MSHLEPALPPDMAPDAGPPDAPAAPRPPDAVIREGLEGRLDRYEGFASAHVEPRTVDVWLPPGYDETPEHRRAVLYLHDGQNLFLPELSFSGVDWGVDEALGRLSGEQVEAPLVVAIWNTPKRIAEYMPQRPMEEGHHPRLIERFAENYGHAPCSDAYLRFVVDEVKPFVDGAYRTHPGREHTFVMGSSMGGLVSLYALCAYPDVFGGAACLSTSWTVGGRVLVPYLRRNLPEAATHRVYFDYGVEAHIGRYEFYQRKVDLLFESAGYGRGYRRLTRRFPGAEHSEAAWRARLDVPLRFLLRR